MRAVFFDQYGQPPRLEELPEPRLRGFGVMTVI